MKLFIPFSKTLNFECLMLEIHSKHNLQNKRMGKTKKEDDTCLKKKKTKEKQNVATITMSVDGKGTVLTMKLKL